MLNESRKSTFESGVAEIWRTVLQLESPPAYDVNFFDAGGTSLGLVRMRALLHERFGVEMRGVDLFRFTTIETLAAHVAERAAAS